jgi:hypothetical protein
MGLSANQAEDVLQWINRRDAEEINALAADRLARFFALLMPSNTKRKISIQILGSRTLAALWLLNRHGEQSLTELAERAAMSKQLLDFHVQRLRDALDFRAPGQKRDSARAAYSEAARERWSALTPEERKARRRGERGIVGTQHMTPNTQFDTSTQAE